MIDGFLLEEMGIKATVPLFSTLRDRVRERDHSVCIGKLKSARLGTVLLTPATAS